MEESELASFKEWLNEKSKKKTRARLQESTKKQYISQLAPEHLPLDAQVLQAKIYGNKSLLFNAAIKNYLLFKQESGAIDRKGYLNLVKELDFKMMSSMHDSKLTFEELKKEVLSNQERDLLFAYSGNKFYPMIMRVLYDTAARKSEIIYQKRFKLAGKTTGITVKDVVPQPDGTASIQIQGKGYGVKSRTVYLEPDTLKLVNEYVQEKGLQSDSPLIEFARRDGKPYEDQGGKLWRVLKKLGKDIIARPIKPHSFRHTKLTDMVNSGARIDDVQSYAGHADITTTRIYAKMSEIQSKRGFDASRRIKND